MGKSSKKNQNAVIKEVKMETMRNLMIPNLSLLSDEQIKELLDLYKKYENTQIFSLDTALENKYYLAVQKKLFLFLNLEGFEDIKINTLKMFYIRQNHLEKLGLELVD